jgi:Ser/Thr protein kinase RdoA (MazF antagonist)
VTTPSDAAAVVIARWALVEPVHLSPIPGGLINQTFLVESGGGARHVLQRVHPVFGPEVHLDIDAITRHLETRGVTTPRLVPTRDGALWVVDDGGGVWRLQTFVDGRSFARVDGPARTEAAGRLVARFHAALADLAHTFHFRRAFVHDTAHHRRVLEEALADERAHALYDDVARLADALFAAHDGLPRWESLGLPTRVVHGDLKISNVLFDDDGSAVCLVDLDTVAPMLLPFELGDAWRSWCNPAGEDTVETRFDIALLEGAWRGYGPAARDFLRDDERENLVAGVLTIAVELSMRFATDALRERYFGWDAARFPSRGAHNLVRARGQHALYASLAAQRSSAEAIIR